MEKMSRTRSFSSPELQPSSSTQIDRPDDYTLEGIATNVKLLLKLIQENHEASSKDHDDRKTQRIAGMITILDDVKSRIEKSQPGKKRAAELRRCNTDLRQNGAPREKKPQEPITDEKEKLRKQLSASLAARKSLEILCSSLGKENEIMASELARKVHVVNEMEELVDDLKAHNEKLLAKLQSHGAEQERKYSSIGGEAQGDDNAALRAHSKDLSQQLLKSLDSYRSLKQKYRKTKEQNIGICTKMEETREEAVIALERIHSFRQRLAGGNHQTSTIEEEISELEKMFERFSMKLAKLEKKSIDANPTSKINVSKPPIIP